MDLLTFSEIREISNRADLPLLLNPTQDSIGLMDCQICNCYRPRGMILHARCRRFVCALDAINLLENNMNCPFCREVLRNSDYHVTSRTIFTRPSPNDQFFMDKIKFQCTFCEVELLLEEAKQHNASCSRNPARSKHQPPAPLQPRGLAPPVRREVISNNVADDRPERPERLIVFHHNGTQIKTRMHNSLMTIRELKSFVSNLTGVQIENLQMVKFIHKVLVDDDILDDVAHTDGCTYLATFSELSDVRGRSLHLILEEVGPPHITDEQRRTQVETRRRRIERSRERMQRLNIVPQPRPRLARQQRVAYPADYLDELEEQENIDQENPWVVDDPW